MQYTVEEVSVHPKSPKTEGRTLELADEDIVLDTEYRSANRLVVAVARASESRSDDAEDDGNPQCVYVKDDGKRCSRDAEDGQMTCWQHDKEDVMAKADGE